MAEESSKKVPLPAVRFFVLCEPREMRATNDLRVDELRKRLIAASQVACKNGLMVGKQHACNGMVSSGHQVRWGRFRKGFCTTSARPAPSTLQYRTRVISTGFEISASICTRKKSQ